MNFDSEKLSTSIFSDTPGENKNYHRFHRVKGGFLEVETEQKGRESFPHFRLRNAIGAQAYAHTLTQGVKA